MSRLKSFWRWANGTRPRSWLFHALLAAVVAAAFTQLAFVTPEAAALTAAWAYCWREAEQTINRLAANIQVDWLDAALDVVAAAIGAVGGAALGGLL